MYTSTLWSALMIYTSPSLGLVGNPRLVSTFVMSKRKELSISGYQTLCVFQDQLELRARLNKGLASAHSAFCDHLHCLGRVVFCSEFAIIVHLLQCEAGKNGACSADASAAMD